MFRPSPSSSLTPWGNGLWQWYNWRWPLYAHQFTTRTIWPPGNVRFRDKAWQPDVSGWTLARFQFDLGNWTDTRHPVNSRWAVDMNTGSVVTWPPPPAPVPPPPPEPPPPPGPGVTDMPFNVIVFKNSGHYTPSPSMRSVEVVCRGSGAGGVSVSLGSLNDPNGAGGGGGGSGARSRAVFLAAAIGAGIDVSIGPGGAPNGNGSTTSFGSLLTAPGGQVGSGPHGGAPGAVGTAAGQQGDAWLHPGNFGLDGVAATLHVDNTTGTTATGGAGAAGEDGSPSGPSLTGLVLDNFTAAGQNGAPNTGAGGSGAAVLNNGNAPGGSGGSGVCVITEYS
jgi:hypothetical protein